MAAELLVCVNRRLTEAQPSCGARGGEDLARALERIAGERGLAVEIVRIHCFGQCARGPNVRRTGGPFVHRGQAADAAAILDRLLAGG